MKVNSFFCLVLLVALSSCAPSGVAVNWTTATETRTAGFNLYRAESPDGPFVQANPAIIPGSSDPLRGGHYEFQDTAADCRQDHYYKLVEIDQDGAATSHGPILVSGSPLCGPTQSLAIIGTGVLLASAILFLFSRSRSRS